MTWIKCILYVLLSRSSKSFTSKEIFNIIVEMRLRDGIQKKHSIISRIINSHKCRKTDYSKLIKIEGNHIKYYSLEPEFNPYKIKCNSLESSAGFNVFKAKLEFEMDPSNLIGRGRNFLRVAFGREKNQSFDLEIGFPNSKLIDSPPLDN